MDKLILICFCFSLLTSHLQCVSSESEIDENERFVLPKDLLQNGNLLPEGLPVLSADTELPKSGNNSDKNDNKEQLPVLNTLSTYAETENNESNLDSVTVGASVGTSTESTHDVTSSSNIKTNNEDISPSVFIDYKSDIEKNNDVNRSSISNTNKNFGLAQPEKPFLSLGNASASVETSTDATVSTNKDNNDWFYQEKNNDDDDEDYTENEGNKDDSEEYKDEGDDFVLGEHDNDDDEEYDVTKWIQRVGDDNDDTDWDDVTEDDFDESKSHLVDELAKKNKQLTAPTRMVLFYTLMIVAVLLIVVVVSTYQSRCKGFRFFGAKSSNPKDDRKRLMEHEFI